MTTEIMFQAFKWDATINGRIGDWYEYVEKTVLPVLVAAKITHLWFPPPSKSRQQDWVGYTPMDYYDLGEYRQWVQVWDDAAKQLAWQQHGATSSLDLDAQGNKVSSAHDGTETLWGHRSELDRLLKTCHQQGMQCIADIVINHRDPQQVNAQDEWISWGSDEHVIASKRMVWGYKGKDDDPEEIHHLVGGAGEDDGEGGYAANIAHRSAKARKDIKDWLAWMQQTAGFDGWRYDFVKGYAPERIAEYNYHTGNPFSVGEYRECNAQLIYDWIDGTDAHHVSNKSLAFDFPLQDHLRRIFWGAKPFDQLGLWKYSSVSIAGGWPEKAVTFLDNHDTARKPFEDFPADKKRLLQGYAFLLTHPGVPCIFFSHLMERGSQVRKAITDLCLLRRAQGIKRTSWVEVLRSAPACYAALIDGRVIVKIGDEFWGPDAGAGWKLSLWDEGWAVWTK